MVRLPVVTEIMGERPSLVQWLRLYLPMQGVWVGSIPGLGAKIAYTSRPEKPKHKTSNIVTNSIKTLKMVHIKKILKKHHGEILLPRPSFCACYYADT